MMARNWLALPLLAGILVAASCSAPAMPGAPAVPDASAGTEAPAAGDGLVDVGDARSIYAKCEGEGSPTVVLIAGKGNGAQDWQDVLAPGDPVHDTPGDDVPWGMGQLEPSDAAVFPSTAQFTRVCTYDRPDIRVDESNVTTPREQPHTLDLDVADLHALLESLGEPGPYVLVSHSYGGLIANLYAREYPDAVAGLVMVDTVTPLMAEVATAEQLTNWDATNSTVSPQVREGVRLLDAFERIDAMPPIPSVPAVVLAADKPWRTDLLPPEVAEVNTVTFENWLASLELLAESLGAEHITQTDSGHDIYLYNSALVVDQIRRVVEEVRAGGALE